VPVDGSAGTVALVLDANPGLSTGFAASHLLGGNFVTEHALLGAHA